MSNFAGTELMKNFSQSEVLKRLLPQMKEGGNIVENGICYMLAIEWIRKAVDSGSMTPEEFIPYSFEEKDMAYYKQIANNFIACHQAYIKAGGGTGEAFMKGFIELKDPADKLHADKTFCGLCSYDRLNALSITECKTGAELEKVFYDGNIVYLGQLNFMNTGNRVGHEVAFRRWAGDTIFFDPNFGVHKITDYGEFITGLLEFYGKADILYMTSVGN